MKTDGWVAASNGFSFGAGLLNNNLYLALPIDDKYLFLRFKIFRYILSFEP